MCCTVGADIRICTANIAGRRRNICITQISLHTRFFDQTSFVESFVASGAGGAGTGFGVAAINISRTLAGAVFRVAHFATKARTAAAVVAGVSAVLTPGFVRFRCTAPRAAAARVARFYTAVLTAIAVAISVYRTPIGMTGITTSLTAGIFGLAVYRA